MPGRISKEDRATGDLTDAIANVLGLDEPTGMTAKQREIFGLMAEWVSGPGIDPDGAMMSLQRHIGNYWRSGMLIMLQSGSYRPSAIRKIFGALNPDRPLSMRILSLNLKMLEYDGLIERIAIPGVNHVEYQLSPFGHEVAKQVISLGKWIGSRVELVNSARALYELDN
ncbi:winged helix-turn-helix transcriptional regulator [Croceicoccus bisphenolivorans]|uniref:winged helix-turn-helix transcriptional regulator n=1 Tax=Croceicoccus bisphenolivorans TaxID=1783232 RepID=UPI00082A53A8|nr:winged helix-turn-helix transcriptional regulator [Croceicoccus bisphenolivorans]